MKVRLPGQSDYLDMYQYLTVLDTEQIFKLRNVAIGVLDMTAFSHDEIDRLESRMLIAEETGAR